MSKLREIKRRIKSVNNIGKVTHAMQMVAASRMRKAQERAENGKAYSEKIKEMMVRVQTANNEILHPMMDPDYSESNTMMVVVFSPQRGLAGSLPGSIVRYTTQVLEQLKEEGYDIAVVTVGRKVRDLLSRRGYPIVADFSEMPENPTTADTRPLVTMIEEEYMQQKVKDVLMVYPEFINAVTQETLKRVLLPIDRSQFTEYDEKFEDNEEWDSSSEFTFEPNVSRLMDALIPQYLETQLYQARLETVASEYSARMVAMKNATDNAKEIKDDLNISFNKSRQAQITAEISEIVATAL